MPTLASNALPEAQTAAAYAVFLVSYLVFALGKFPGMKIDRPGAAIIGAVLSAIIFVPACPSRWRRCCLVGCGSGG